MRNLTSRIRDVPNSLIIVLCAAFLVLCNTYDTIKSTVNEWFPQSIRVEVRDISIYKTSPNVFPTCEVTILGTNPRETVVALNFVTMSVGNNFKVSMSVPLDSGTIVLPASIPSFHTWSFKHPALDTVLMLPFDSTTFSISFAYRLIGEQTDTIHLADKELVKCTYWQTPSFASDYLPEELDLQPFRGSVTLHHSSASSGDTGSVWMPFSMYTSKESYRSFDLDKILRGMTGQLKPGDYGASIDAMSDFKKRYGGLYAGIIDTSCFTIRYLPHEYLSSLDEYKLLGMFGYQLHEMSDSISQFIHFSFNPEILNPAFESHQVSDDYFVMIVSEESKGIQNLYKVIDDAGFRSNVFFVSDVDKFIRPISSMISIPNIVKLSETMNENLESIGNALDENGAITLWLGEKDKRTEQLLDSLVSKVLGINPVVSIALDCRPYLEGPVQVLNSSIVILYTNFTDQYDGIVIDSIGIAWE